MSRAAPLRVTMDCIRADQTNREESQQLREARVDTAYELWTNSIANTCDEILNHEQTEQQRRTRTFKDGVPSARDRTAAVRAYKRSCRGTEPTIRGTHQEVREHLRNLWTGDGVAPQPQWRGGPTAHFSASQVGEAINKYDKAKTGGTDGIHILILQTLAGAPEFNQLTADMFNFFITSSTAPKKWNDTLVHLIPKDQDNPIISLTRPISLTQVTRRIFERIWLKEWPKEEWTKTEETQHGFKKGLNCTTQLATVIEKFKGGLTTLGFLDLRAAYDKVNLRILFQKLKGRGCPEYFTHLLWTMFGRPGWARSTLNGNEVEGIARNAGLLQGSSLSPALFNTYIDDLAKSLREGGLNAAIFADDIALLEANRTNIQRSLEICQKWAGDNSMEFNISKCGIIGKGPSLFLGDKEIPNITSYKYLGAQVNARNGVDLRSTAKQQEAAVERQARDLRDRCRAWGKDKAGWIVDTFVRPKGEYLRPLGHLWSNTRRSEVQVEVKERRRRIEDTIWQLANTGESLPDTEEMKIEAREKKLARGVQESMRKLPRSNWLWAAAEKRGSLAELLMKKKI